MITSKLYTGGIFQTNAWLIQNDTANILIDAPSESFEWTQDQGVNITDVLLTHQHFDHIEDAVKFSEAGATLHAYQATSDELTLTDTVLKWGIELNFEKLKIDSLLRDQNSTRIGEETFQIFHVPGHSPDSIVFYSKERSQAFVGDTLMAGGIGRSDFPNGDHQALINGIKQHILTLPPKTEILSGHGPATTVEREQASNQFVGS